MRKKTNENSIASAEEVSCPQNKSFLSAVNSASCDYIDDSFVIHDQKDLWQLASNLSKNTHLIMGLEIQYGFYFSDVELETKTASSNLAEVLARYEGLIDFHVQNLADKKGHRLISRVVQKNTRIRSLTLMSFGLQWRGVKDFFNILQKNTTLTALKLEFPLDQGALASLRRLFESDYRKVIQHLSLREAKLSKESGDLLLKPLINSRKLATLYLDYQKV